MVLKGHQKETTYLEDLVPQFPAFFFATFYPTSFVPPSLPSSDASAWLAGAAHLFSATLPVSGRALVVALGVGGEVPRTRAFSELLLSP